MKEINLHNLKIDEVNSILRALSALPYSQVNALIEKIQSQARVQLEQGNGTSHHAEQEVKNN
jgi:hypothetical protein